jgi:crotonobetaine/carnitine-CoA ligase
MPDVKDYPYLERVLPFILEDKAKVMGAAPFIVGDGDLTYAQTLDRTARLGGGLLSLGVHKGDRVLTMLPNVIEAVVAFMGISWIGAVEVPINSGYRGEMLRYIIDDAQADILVIHSEFVQTFLDVAEFVPSLRRLVVIGDTGLLESSDRFDVTIWTDLLAASLPAERADLHPGDLQAIMYTSGTTGPSKGVMVPYHCAYQYANPAGTHFQALGDVVYVTLPLFHIGGQWQGIYAALLAEGRAVLKSKFSVSEFWTDVDQYGINQTTLLGVMAEFMWKREQRDDDADHPLTRVTICPAPQDAEAFGKRFGVRLSQGWGLTETGSVTSPGPLNEPAQDPATCGRVRADLFELMLVDDDDEPVAPGTPGQAVVRPKQPFAMMSGYWRKPEATVQSWRNLWFHTGDALVEDGEGVYTFVDRQKDCIRRRGENISSLEVELAVLTHPDVLECAAVPARTDHAEDEVMIVVSPRAGATIDPAALHAYLVPRMPAFMVPRYIEVMAELPKTTTSKIKKDALRAAGPGPAAWDNEKTLERQRT